MKENNVLIFTLKWVCEQTTCFQYIHAPIVEWKYIFYMAKYIVTKTFKMVTRKAIFNDKLITEFKQSSEKTVYVPLDS